MENTTPLMLSDYSSGNLRDFLIILFKRKTAILTIFLTTVITVTIGSFLWPRTYEAKSSILIKFGREYVYRSEVGEDRIPQVTSTQEEFLNSEVNILTSRDNLERVIKTLKPETFFSARILWVKNLFSKITPLDMAISNFEKGLNVDAIKKSSVIEVSFSNKDPQIAALALNLLVEFFKEKHLAVYGGTESTFLKNQLSLYDKELKKSENLLEAFKQKNRIYSLEEQRSLLLNQRNNLDSSLKNTQNQIDEMANKLASFRKQMATILNDKNLYTQTERDKIVVEARAKLLSLQLSEQDISSKYPADNRLLINIQKEIQIIRAFLREQEETIGAKVKTANPVYQDAEKEANRAEAEEGSLRARAVTMQQQIAQLDSQIKAMDLWEKDLRELRRDVVTNEKNFRTYQEKMEEARISNEMNRQKMANISVIQTARPPTKPIKPKIVLNILLSLVLGSVSALGFAFFCEYTSQSYVSPDSVEKRLGLPVLTTIPLNPGITGVFKAFF